MFVSEVEEEESVGGRARGGFFSVFSWWCSWVGWFWVGWFWFEVVVGCSLILHVEYGFRFGFGYSAKNEEDEGHWDNTDEIDRRLYVYVLFNCGCDAIATAPRVENEIASSGFRFRFRLRLSNAVVVPWMRERDMCMSFSLSFFRDGLSGFDSFMVNNGKNKSEVYMVLVSVVIEGDVPRSMEWNEWMGRGWF